MQMAIMLGCAAFKATFLAPPGLWMREVLHPASLPAVSQMLCLYLSQIQSTSDIRDSDIRDFRL